MFLNNIDSIYRSFFLIITTFIVEKNSLLDHLTEESTQHLLEYEETKKQIEEDADSEILDINNKFEKKLRDEKEANLRLKGETGLMKRKV